MDSKEITLNNFFDKIFYINLDHRIDRNNECIVEFKKHNIVAERISAINGYEIYKEKTVFSGNQGLLLTNIKILEYAIKNNFKNILILEDDIMFIDNINEIFLNKIKLLPNDWDFIYMGGSHMFNKGKFKCISSDINFEIDSNNYKQLNNELCETTWTQTTHAVGINSKMFDFLLNLLKENTKPIDMIYCQLQQSGYKTFTFLPSIALQRPSYSDIENVIVDYNKNKRWTF